MTDLDPGVLIRFRNWLDSGCDEPYMIEQFREDLRALLAAVDAVDLGPEALCIAEGCPHCPDGHRDPNTRPWSASMSVYRDRDRQPTHLIVAPSAGGHVAESDAEWLRQVIRDAKARYRPLTDEPCGVIPTPAGLDYLASRRQQHPRTRP